MKEAGLSLGDAGPRSMMEMQMEGAQRPVAVRFHLVNPDAVREEATKAAIADARAKAERLARLSGVKIGRVVSVHEVPYGGDDESGPMAYLAFFAGGAGKKDPTLATNKFETVKLFVSLQVRFAIEP
jgi:uncharacterized protein